MERASPSKSIRHGTRKHKQASDYEGVRVHHPLKIGKRRPEVLLNGGQRYVDNCHVHAHEHQAQAANTENEIGSNSVNFGDRL